MIEREFNIDQLYNRIVHYYIDKKGFTKEKANSIAQRVIRRRRGAGRAQTPTAAIL